MGSRARLVGSREPRVFTRPLRPLEPRTKATEQRTLGYAAIDFALTFLGIVLHPWQEWLLIHLLELLPNGDLRFRTVLVLVARQNGKTTVSTVVALFFMYMLRRKLVIGTAQDLDVAEEIWQAAVDLVLEGMDDVPPRPVRPDLAELVENVNKTNGKKALELSGGEKWKVKALTRKAGRSLAADLIMLDELREHHTWTAWSAITKTTMARMFALILCLSNAGDSLSVVLNHLRLLAHLALGNPDGLDELEELEPPADLVEEYGDDLGLFEWSGRPGCALDSREDWCWSNPSLGSPVDTENLVTERAIANALRTDPEKTFREEVLCQVSAPDNLKKISLERWATLGAPKSKAPARCGWGLDVSPDRLHASIVAAGDRGDGKTLVFVAEADVGTGWIVPKLRELKREKGLRRIAVDARPGSQAGALIRKIREAGIDVEEYTGPRIAQACGDLLELTRVPLDEPGGLVHLDDALLFEALSAAETATVGDGGWCWVRRTSNGNITPLMGGTLAVAEATNARKPAWGGGPGGGEDRQERELAAVGGNPFRDSGRLGI